MSAALSSASVLVLLSLGCSASGFDPSEAGQVENDAGQDAGSPSADAGVDDAGVDNAGGLDGAAADESGDFAAIPLDAEMRSEIDELVRPLVDPEGAAGKAIGLSIAVVGPTLRDVLGYGTTTKGGSIIPKADTVFEIGSITKVITGLLLAQHVVDGRVALDDPAAQYLPSETVVPSASCAPITLRHLATHTSGLPQMPPNLVGSPPNPAAGYTPALLYEFLARCRTASVPGTEYAYSNVGIGLLGHVLSLLNRKASYDDLIEDVIATRIGMKDTRIDASGALADRRAHGYDAGTVVPPNVIDTIEAAGALRSTGADLVRFMEAGIAPPSTIALPMALLLSPQADVGPEPGAEMGLAIAIGQEAGAQVFLKAGTTGGFSSFMIFSSEIGIGVAVLANDHRFDASGLAKEIFRRLAANG
ncbi:MAG: beta-lactamase family protein [Deltaproteobacteria bacterium]|nr:beta-lactamase family protein [Deltaproteobacteria bacterium]